MSIANEITRLQGAKEALKQSIKAKGVSVSDDATIDTYASKVDAIEQGGGGSTGYTGHVDEEGLRYIGWTDDDIAYFKTNICWNAEEDDYYKVTDYDKQKWDNAKKTVVDGVTMCVGNNTIVKDSKMRYLPKTDTSSLFSSNMFQGDINLIAIPSISIKKLSNVSYFFYNCTNLVSFALTDMGEITTMSFCFQDCISLRRIDLSGWIFTKVTSCSFMFNGCKKLETVKFGDSVATNLNGSTSYMFFNCNSLKEVDLSRFVTSKVTDMSGMFGGCNSLKHINLSNFDTTRVSSMFSMFDGCNKLEYLDIRNFVTNNVTTLQLFSTSIMARLKVFRHNLNLSKNSTSGCFTSLQAPYASEDFDTVADTLRCLPTYSYTGTTFRFYPNSKVKDDENGTLAALMADAVNAGWTIANLTII